MSFINLDWSLTVYRDFIAANRDRLEGYENVDKSLYTLHCGRESVWLYPEAFADFCHTFQIRFGVLGLIKDEKFRENEFARMLAEMMMYYRSIMNGCDTFSRHTFNRLDQSADARAILFHVLEYYYTYCSLPMLQMGVAAVKEGFNDAAIEQAMAPEVERSRNEVPRHLKKISERGDFLNSWSQHVITEYYKMDRLIYQPNERALSVADTPDLFKAHLEKLPVKRDEKPDSEAWHAARGGDVVPGGAGVMAANEETRAPPSTSGLCYSRVQDAEGNMFPCKLGRHCCGDPRQYRSDGSRYSQPDEEFPWGGTTKTTETNRRRHGQALGWCVACFNRRW